MAKRIDIWRTADWRRVRAFDDFAATVNSLAFGADGDRFVAATLDGLIYLGRVSTGEIITLHDHTKSAWWVAFSPNGRKFASGGLDGMIVVWDVAAVDQTIGSMSPSELAEEANRETGFHLEAERAASCKRCNSASW